MFIHVLLIRMHAARFQTLSLIKKETEIKRVMSQSVPTGCIPPGQPPGISSKSLPGGWDLTFKVARGPEIQQGPGFCEK